MAVPDAPFDIDRRSFLKSAACGLFLSVAAVHDAHGIEGQTVTFTSEGFAFAMVVPHGQPARLLSLRNSKTNFEWARSKSAFDPVFSSAEKSIEVWRSGKGRRKRAATGDGFQFASNEKDGPITARSAMRAFRDSPILEFQTEFENTAHTPLSAVTGFGPFRFALRDDLGELRVHTLRRDAYGLKTIPVEGPLALAGGRWNAPEFGGLLLLEAVGKQEFLLVGIEWERGWTYLLEKTNDGTWLSVHVSDLTHDMAAKEKLSSPRVFLGLARGSTEDAFLTARRYMQKHVFLDRPKNWPWVVYDFWATEPQGVEEALFSEVDFAAKLGIDVFVHDASWYEGSSKKGTGDWGCGIGHYNDDRQKLPSGLAAISRRVKDRGMKFGLWVGPNVVDSRIVGTVIPERWIAQSGGKDNTLHPDGWESSVHQVCMGCREYTDFLKKQLSRIVREFNLDWLKWDNSGIPGSPAGCDRSDHGHQSGDASYVALVRQYEIFEHLHTLYPDLVLEQCGYGSRLDYGLARTIRSNWLSDASYPSNHVRQNALFANYLYPSADNGAWIVLEEKALWENINNPAELDTIFRSRMMSLFGFGTILGLLKERISLFPEPILAAARRNLPVYKRYRHLLQDDCYHLSRLIKSDSNYQAVQFISSSAEESVVLVFKAGSTQDELQLPLLGLRHEVAYEITFANGAASATVQGADLMTKGISVSLARATSEVVLLKQRK
jgi:alpha-galactosidase